ncbi:MAG: 6,7-dimethyl-8-ribityllumazine synthase [Planctomycetota bacterium]|nr:6,7-dimethyl-8-ribityllumazine synthase [Planctomycetota bacterium]
MRVFEGEMSGKGKKFAVVVSRFNNFVTGKLLDGAIDVLKRHGVKEDDVTVVWVPGSFELPLVVKKMAGKKEYDAVIAVGALIRGQTPHFEYLSRSVTEGLSRIALESSKPVAFGIVTAESLEQAIERAGAKGGNKGADAASAALEMVTLLEKIG